MKKIKHFLKNKELKKKIIFSIFCLFLFRLGNNILISSVDVSKIQSNGGFEIFNLITGADMTSFTIFALGLSPYITGSIIIELLSNNVIPVFTRWKKNNEVKKRTTASNICGLGIAVMQSFGITLMMDKTYGILKYADIYSYLYTMAILIAGSCFLLWLTKQIDTYGIGNGSSIIIASGILYKMPMIIDNAYNYVVTYKDWTTFITFALLMISFLSVICFTVFIEKSERRIPIQFSDGKTNIIGKKNDHLPIKVDVAGVIPVIFSSSVLQTPIIIANVFGQSPSWLSYLNFNNPIGICLYAVLIVFFTYFYSHTIINAKDINNNFQKTGCNIISVRLGQDTINYINKVLNKVCAIGSMALLIIALIPIVLPLIWSTAAEAGLTIGGTSLIIVTGVTIDIYTRIKGEMTRKEYKTKSMFWK